MRRFLFWFFWTGILVISAFACDRPSGICNDQRPCKAGFGCVQGRCEAIAECDDQRPCKAGFGCVRGRCEAIAECDDQRPCKAGFGCVQGRCKTCEGCQEESLRCSPDAQALQQCIVIAEGCTSWARSIPCGEGTCQNTRCVKSCLNNGQRVALCPSDRPVCYEGNCCKEYRCDENRSECSPTDPFVRRLCQRENAECYEWKELPCEAGTRCADCKEGEVRCSLQNPSVMEVCHKDATGCVGWKERPCVGGGTCNNVCRSGETRCSSTKPEGIETCEIDAVGCFVWKETKGCTGGAECVKQGLCLFHECAFEHDQSCATNEEYKPVVRTCLRDVQGRLRWKTTAVCTDSAEECIGRLEGWEWKASCSMYGCAASTQGGGCLADGSIWHCVSAPALCGVRCEPAPCPDPGAYCVQTGVYPRCIKSDFFSCTDKPVGTWVCQNESLLKCDKTPQGKWIKEARSCEQGCPSLDPVQGPVCPCSNSERRCLQNSEEECVNGAWQKVRDCRAEEECHTFYEGGWRCSDFPIDPSEAASVERVSTCRYSRFFSRCGIKKSLLAPTPP